MRFQFRKMFFRPAAKLLERFDQCSAKRGQSVFDLRRRDWVNLAAHQAIAFEAAQGLREHFLRDVTDLPLQRGISQGTARENLNDQGGPFVGNPIENEPRRTSGAQDRVSSSAFCHEIL